MAEARGASALPWEAVEIYWGDERCVPPDDPASNYRRARRDLLDRLPVPPAAVERIRGELGPVAAADDYEAKLVARLGERPALDVVVLGVGADGHTASLFPGQAAAADRWVVPGLAPEEPRERVSLAPRCLDAARLVVVLAAGRAKSAAVAAALAGGAPPAGRLRPRRLVWLVDEAAATGLPPELRRRWGGEAGR